MNNNENNESNRADITLKKGTLIRGIGSFYTVRDSAHQEYTLRCKKKFRRDGISPLVGDEVLFSPGQGEEHGWLEEILPRKTECLRPPVANVTKLVIMTAPVPEPDLLLVDRQISRAYAQGMDILLVVNKCDLNPDTAEQMKKEYNPAGIQVIPISAKTGKGLEQLRKALTGSALCCFTGQSGAGKSTTLNALLDLDLETGTISRKIARGKNTTRHTELIEKNGIRVMDTAGFNLLEAENALDPGELKNRYPEFAPYEGKCRFRECLHDREPGCAVTAAAEKGEISSGRLERYRELLAEAKTVWRDRYD
ncbi:ribosome small subunit-dependent GTPase A [Aristaeella hokkaidonensis]|uniref:Ribosome small subunit-dependent GTPase A n=1 Tax=Aristaeella hokkaidonensis TaxID=3046382 RepID=A0AC61N473_9FIRM|nr:ribosome small subunit-dependent GTPase A [Aristaeella hokkaidonensis]QUC67890.1 ribosome small subunit-dependent GTPase A [Aristaeella hokkaidonensis]SNT92957.1 ribosome biogenesis GTPase [Aristaeella hokkaidonensis]